MSFLTSTDTQNVVQNQVSHFASMQAYAAGLSNSVIPGSGPQSASISGGGGVDPRYAAMYPGAGVLGGGAGLATGYGGAAMGILGAGRGAAELGAAALPFAAWAGAAPAWADPFMGTLGAARSTAMAAMPSQYAGMGLGRGLMAMHEAGAPIGGVVGRGLMGGAMAAGGYMAAGHAFGWSLDQIIVGAQQNFMLGSMLNQTVNRNTMPNLGGLGGVQGTGQIAEMMRSMQGFQSGFEDLTNIMGQGIAGGWFRTVQNIQQFKTRFRELIDNTKMLATVMTGSQQEALMSMEVFHGAGFTGIQGAGAAAAQSALMANAIGMPAMQMAGVVSGGANIARRYGGRGIEGALTAQRLAGQLGTAYQTGAIPEEMLQDVAGVGGMQGVQLMSQRWTQSAYGNLMSGRGKRLIGALMDPGTGEISPGLAQQFASGEMETKDINRLYREHMRSREARYGLRARQSGLASQLIEEIGAPTAIGRMAMEEAGRHTYGAMPDVQDIILQKATGFGENEARMLRGFISRMPSLQSELKSKLSRSLDEAISTNWGKEMMSWDRIKHEIYERTVGKIARPLQEWGASLYTSISGAVTETIQDAVGVHPSFVGPQFRAAEQRALYGDVTGARQMLGLPSGGAGGGVSLGGGRFMGPEGVMYSGGGGSLFGQSPWMGSSGDQEFGGLGMYGMGAMGAAAAGRGLPYLGRGLGAAGRAMGMAGLPLRGAGLAARGLGVVGRVLGRAALGGRFGAVAASWGAGSEIGYGLRGLATPWDVAEEAGTGGLSPETSALFGTLLRTGGLQGGRDIRRGFQGRTETPAWYQFAPQAGAAVEDWYTKSGSFGALQADLLGSDKDTWVPLQFPVTEPMFGGGVGGGVLQAVFHAQKEQFVYTHGGGVPHIRLKTAQESVRMLELASVDPKRSAMAAHGIKENEWSQVKSAGMSPDVQNAYWNAYQRALDGGESEVNAQLSGEAAAKPVLAREIGVNNPDLEKRIMSGRAGPGTGLIPAATGLGLKARDLAAALTGKAGGLAMSRGDQNDALDKAVQAAYGKARKSIGSPLMDKLLALIPSTEPIPGGIGNQREYLRSVFEGRAGTAALRSTLMDLGAAAAGGGPLPEGWQGQLKDVLKGMQGEQGEDVSRFRGLMGQIMGQKPEQAREALAALYRGGGGIAQGQLEDYYKRRAKSAYAMRSYMGQGAGRGLRSTVRALGGAGAEEAMNEYIGSFEMGGPGVDPRAVLERQSGAYQKFIEQMIPRMKDMSPEEMAELQEQFGQSEMSELGMGALRGAVVGKELRKKRRKGRDWEVADVLLGGASGYNRFMRRYGKQLKEGKVTNQLGMQADIEGMLEGMETAGGEAIPKEQLHEAATLMRKRMQGQDIGEAGTKKLERFAAMTGAAGDRGGTQMQGQAITNEFIEKLTQLLAKLDTMIDKIPKEET